MPFCSPSAITIPKDRFRVATSDDPDVVKIALSIKDIGQLQPVLVTKQMELVDGLHRVLACQSLSREVWFEDEETARLILDNPLQRRVAELQANVKRKEFTPMELSLAIAEVDSLMRQIYGSREPGRPSSDGPETWSYKDTAAKMGYKSKGTVSDAVAVAKAIKAKSEISEAINKAKTMQEAVKIVRDTAKLEAIKELAKRQERRQAVNGVAPKETPLEFFSKRLILGEALEKLRGLQAGTVHMFITDPPWGVEVHKKASSDDRSHAGATAKAQGTYEDSPDTAIQLMEACIKEFYRVGKPDCWVVMFCSIKYWEHLCSVFRENGFAVYNKPLVWVKLHKDGTPYHTKSPSPTAWPASCTDFMVLARKGEPALAKFNEPDAFLYESIVPSKRIHQSQKPVSLLKDIISRFYHAGINQLLIDPFAGSGSTLLAAKQLGMTSFFGFELNPEFRERAIAWLATDGVGPESAKEFKQRTTTAIYDLSDFEDEDEEQNEEQDEDSQDDEVL